MNRRLELQLMGYRLTTAEITYHRPDHSLLLQQYIWQDLDLEPRFPVLTRFLEFWESNLDGKLHSVRVLGTRPFGPERLRHAVTALSVN